MCHFQNGLKQSELSWQDKKLSVPKLFWNFCLFLMTEGLKVCGLSWQTNCILEENESC
jgi:hypothetical protein